MGKLKFFHWWDDLSIPSKLSVIGLAVPVLVLNLWSLASIFRPLDELIACLLVASLIALLLNYPINWAENHGMRRELASVIVLLLTLFLLFTVGITLVPSALLQAQQLAVRLPDWIESGKQQLMGLDLQLEELGLRIDQVEKLGLQINLDVLFTQTIAHLENQLQSLSRELLTLAVGTVSSLWDVLVNILITVVITFYFTLSGNKLWKSLVQWLPDKFQEPFSDTLYRSFHKFFVNQLITVIMMGSTLTLVLFILKVPFGTLFSLTIGTMAFVPFGGSVGIALVTALVALQNIWLGLKFLMAAIVVQQIVENLFIPQVVGKFTGLNPFWIFLSIVIGAKVWGVLGIILAVPIAFVTRTVIIAVRSQSVTSSLDGEKLLDKEAVDDISPEILYKRIQSLNNDID